MSVSKINNAFQTIDRKDFVGDENMENAYQDIPLPIGHGQTISQPYTVSFMLEKLDPLPGNKVLDLGSGSGWTTALLAHLVGKEGRVYGVERISELVKFGQNNLAKYNFPWANISKVGEEYGLPEKAPFDRILVSASADNLPQTLVNQLANNGRMVIPIKNSIYLITKDSRGEVVQQEFPGFVFVPLV